MTTSSTVDQVDLTGRDRAHRAAPRRRLHLVDIENEVGGHVTPSSCLEFLAEYTALGVVGDRDHVVVGCSPHSLRHLWVLPAGWRRVMGPRGPQSADLALIDAEPSPRLLSSYSGLVLASADGGFVDLALRARTAGLELTVVTNVHRRPHHLLRAAADRLLAIDVAIPPRRQAA
jgi:hypothetical protein